MQFILCWMVLVPWARVVVLWFFLVVVIFDLPETDDVKTIAKWTYLIYLKISDTLFTRIFVLQNIR